MHRSQPNHDINEGAQAVGNSGCSLAGQDVKTISTGREPGSKLDCDCDCDCDWCFSPSWGRSLFVQSENGLYSLGRGNRVDNLEN